MPRDREALQDWYRRAMARRIDELRALLDRLQAEDPQAFDEARAIGQALRGSGATFGFPDLTEVSALLETSPDAGVLRRVEGLISELHRITEEGSAAVRPEWLLRAADLPPDSDVLDGVSEVREAWARIAERTGRDQARIADAVARYLDLERAARGAPERSALRLVPEALMAAGRVVPVRETSKSIEVATSEPTSLPMELELRRLTGRFPVFLVAAPEELDEALTAVLDGPAAPAEDVRPPLEEKDLRDRSILVVDDDASQRVMLRSLLEKRGFEVFEAGDGVEALERLGVAGSIGLVVADLNMPRMDGLELIWELRADERRSRLPVIVVTGEVDEILETQLLEEGADDYIRKPLDPRLFLARVEATLRRHEA